MKAPLDDIKGVRGNLVLPVLNENNSEMDANGPLPVRAQYATAPSAQMSTALVYSLVGAKLSSNSSGAM